MGFLVVLLSSVGLIGLILHSVVDKIDTWLLIPSKVLRTVIIYA